MFMNLGFRIVCEIAGRDGDHDQAAAVGSLSPMRHRVK
jgi:hypothetical protein